MSKSVEILEQNGYHFLWIDSQLWMWDIPSEVELQKEQAQQAYGDVLVAGLGLGIVQKFLLQNPRVNHENLLTVEKYKEVYDCCREKGIIVGDTVGGIFICDWFDTCGDDKYDCVIGDIWPEISGEHLDLYKRFKAKALTMLKPDGKIIGWGAEYYEYLIQQERESKRIEELLKDLSMMPSYTHNVYKRVIKRMYEKLPPEQFFDEFAMYLVGATNPNRKGI